MSEAMDGRSQAHRDVLVAFPGQSHPACDLHPFIKPITQSPGLQHTYGSCYATAHKQRSCACQKSSTRAPSTPSPTATPTSSNGPAACLTKSSSPSPTTRKSSHY